MRKFSVFSIGIYFLMVSLSSADSVIILDHTDKGICKNNTFEIWSSGIKQISTLEKRRCWTVYPSDNEDRYIYAKVNDPKMKDGSMKVAVKVLAWDNPGSLEIKYDSYLLPWKEVSLAKTGTMKWKTFTLILPGATFLNRCNGADFRIASDHELSIARIEVRLIKQVIAADRPEMVSDITKISRLNSDAIGFAHSGMFWGTGGMSKEIYKKELDLVKENGFGWLRYWPEWAEAEPIKGKYNWDQSDFMVSEAKKRGISIVGSISYGTSWAADAQGLVPDANMSKYPPKDLSDLKNYVAATVSRYKKDVHYWEGWNEANAIGGFWRVPPSGRDPYEHYVALQKVFYETAKKVDPSCVVMTGGFADDSNFGQHLIKYYEKGLKGTFDVMNVHIYGGDPRDAYVTGQLQTIIRIMKHYGDGDKKIWITETGWPLQNHPHQITQAQQAEWTPWQFAVLLAHPQVERVFFFTLRDVSSNEIFGWYDINFQPRPVVKRWQEFLKTNYPAMLAK